jgi:hypothetical protein
MLILVNLFFRSNKAGKLLAEVLLKGLQGNRYLTIFLLELLGIADDAIILIYAFQACDTCRLLSWGKSYFQLPTVFG